MKKKFYTITFSFVFLTSMIFLTGCLQKINNSGTGSPADDPEGAMLYEFNMVKNPVTGTIPEGTYESERAQANEILQRQQSNNIIALGAYSFVGPNNLGGRTRTIAYDKRFNGGSNKIILAGGVSGGVYKSIDDGATWVRKSPTGEHFSCTSLAQDPRVGFQDIWYYGVGEATGNSAGATGAFYSGNGVYKSVDNGETWARLPTSNVTALETFSVAQDFINKIIVSPTTGYIYIACPATIRRSTDGGVTWATVISGPLASSGQYTDIVVTSTGQLYAAFGGTNDSAIDGVWRSPAGATAGDPGTWVRLAGAGAGGSPIGWNSEPFYGRVVLATVPSFESLVYALYYSASSPACPGAATEAELFRFDEGTLLWTDLSAGLPNEPGCLSGNDPFAVQGGYDLVIAVKPDDPLTVYIGGTNIYRSGDAGATWTRIGGYISAASYGLYLNSHPDIHAIVFSPISSVTMLCGNDGGIQRTIADLATPVVWDPINTGYRTYQYYYVDNDPRVANDRVLGGAQDNGSTRNVGGVGSTFERVWGGDGVSVGLSGASGFEYVGSQLGNIERRPYTWPLDDYEDYLTPPGESGTGLFVTLFKLDPDNTGNLFYANDNALYRTSSASTVLPGTWTSMGGIAAAVGAANDITSIGLTRGAYSPATSSLFLGTSNGKVYRLDDPIGVASGTGPVDITPPGIAAASTISSISTNPRNDDTVLVTVSNYGVTSAYWTGSANTGAPVWTAVEGALTLPSYRSSAIAITSTGVQYFVGTSMGLYNSSGLPGAVAWAQEGPADMGNAVVTDLKLRTSDNKLLVGTHGYGMWYSYFPLAASSTTDYFRSIASGSWSSASTWESSTVSDFSSGVVSPATLTPDVSSNTISILSGHTVTVTASVTTDQTFVNPGGTLVVTGSTLTVSGTGGITVQSTVAGTGRIGTSTGTITGSVTVERFINDAGHRSWRLLSGKSVSGTQTIYDAWQESGAIVANKGTWITSPTYTGANGFDATSVSKSILIHNQVGPSWTTIAVTNTATDILSARQGYMLFVRGDRSYTPTLPTPTAYNTTVLKTTGTLNQGTQGAVLVSATGSGRTLVGNPYASPIDMETIFTGTLNLDQNMYVWDPSLTGNYGVGGFRLVERTGGGAYQQTPVVLGGGPVASATSRYIQSGQAYLLKATGADASVIITESMKTASVSPVNPLVNPPGEHGDQQIIANLMIINPGKDASLADGIRVRFADGYSAKLIDDVEKMGNFAENISSYRDGKKLIVEKRPMINVNDTIFLQITNAGIKDYSLQLGTFDFVQTDLPAKLEDNYLHTKTTIDLQGGITNYDFSVTSDPASSAPDRFRIVFGSGKTDVPVAITGVKGINIYPNPVSNKLITMQFIEMEKGVYTLQLINTMGLVVMTSSVDHSGYNSLHKVELDWSIANGLYRLEFIKPDNHRVAKALVIINN